ncbi:putative ubiquitin-conjugating enzyme E2 [Symbiodinium microadriaticum]|uniref:Putative ubiquitin-conjugating enzyme E2 n=1 Tax=Symbiodinium microadriaticum TaxID=2951 RepID=A0A1Q9C6M2_SYMMI|nr:putative ubiquitin-conjugating enzyme E2 [Symbiodinium microadriaticum]
MARQNRAASAVGEAGADQVFGPREDSFFESDQKLTFDGFKALASRIGGKRAVTSVAKGSQSLMVTPAPKSGHLQHKRNSVGCSWREGSRLALETQGQFFKPPMSGLVFSLKRRTLSRSASLPGVDGMASSKNASTLKLDERGVKMCVSLRLSGPPRCCGGHGFELVHQGHGIVSCRVSPNSAQSFLMGEQLLRAEVQALRERLSAHRTWLQRLDIEDNMIELKIAMQGNAHRLRFLVYEADAYPNSGGMMMSEDDADSDLVEAINTLLTAESLTVMDVLRAASQASKVSDKDLLACLDDGAGDGLQDRRHSDADGSFAFEGDDEGDLCIEAPSERSERPGWKKMKWQEVEDQRLEDQRLATQKRRKGAESMNNEELKAKTEQIFNSSEAFNILSNELFQLQTRMTAGLEADAIDFNVHSWVVKLRGFSNGISEDLKQLKARCGYDYVELRINFREDLYPFYPPSVSIVRPRLLGRHDVQAALACHPRLQLKGWSPFQSSRDMLVSIRSFLDRVARVDLESDRNTIVDFPEGAFSVVEQQLGLLRRLRGIVPLDLRPETLGNAYEDDPWAQSEELQSSSFGAMLSGGRKSTSSSAGPGAASTSSGRWAAGVGYGTACMGRGHDGWDPAALKAAQEAQDLELQQAVSSISRSLPHYETGKDDLADLLSKSCLVPFLEGELAASYTSISERCGIFREVLGLVKQLLVSLPLPATI